MAPTGFKGVGTKLRSSGSTATAGGRVSPAIRPVRRSAPGSRTTSRVDAATGRPRSCDASRRVVVRSG